MMFLVALCVSVFVGCATHERQPMTVSREEMRVLYPREYLDSLDPWERQAVERRMIEDDFQQREQKRRR